MLQIAARLDEQSLYGMWCYVVMRVEGSIVEWWKGYTIDEMMRDVSEEQKRGFRYVVLVQCHHV